MKRLAFLFLIWTTTPLLSEEPPIQYTNPTPIAQDRIKSDLSFADQAKPKARYKSPALTVGLSALFPGLGHAYLGENKTAATLAGTTATSLTTGYTINSPLAKQGATQTLLTAWSYGLYSSYRDARNYNGPENYTYQMPQDTFADLAYAPFNPKILKKPEVWGGIIGGLAAAVGVGMLYQNSYKSDFAAASNQSRHINPLIAFPVGIREEALFRGFIQSAITEVTNPTFGIISSSMLFSAAHIGNVRGAPSVERKRYYTIILPYIALAGMYDGWMTYKNRSLKESTAVHAWYDFIIFAAMMTASQSLIEGSPSLQLDFKF